MKHIRNFAFAALHVTLFAALSARAGHVSETLTLAKGWNAIYLESTPDASAPADFFADLPEVARVGCYESSVYGATEQIASDGTTIAQKPVAFYVWERGKDAESTLQNIMGGRCYLVYATAAATKTFYGVPAIPQISWQAAADGFTTLAGVSIPAGETVSAAAYFREGPLSAAAVSAPYLAGGADASAPGFTQVVAFRGSPQLAAGRAYAFEGARAADWPGVVKVSVASASGALAFSSGTMLQSMTIANAGTTNRTLRVAYEASARADEVRPPLKIYIPRVSTNAYGWTDFATHDFALAPDESRTLVFAVDKSGFAAETDYAALVTVSDLSGTKMRVRVPVTAAADDGGDYAAAFPKGLWYGNVTLSQVDRLSDGNPVTAGGEMKASLMVFVDAAGAAHLLQRVAVGTAEEAATDGTRDVRLWPEAASVPAGYAARRLSTVFPDVAHRSVDAASGAFGDLVAFDWTVAADARDNPFRHAWHPDHATGFAVTNRLALSWHAESGETTWGYSPDEVTYGICSWTLGGLSGTGDVTMRGTFALKRILPISKIEE